MATKSILKDVDIKDKGTAISLINALEKASRIRVKDVEVSRTYADGDDVELFKRIVRGEQ